jgi:outer membrane receptor protein involved in Fe transport
MFFTILFVSTSLIYAGNTGKIFGKVIDEDTGEPLIGVNVVVKGIGQGASTDEQGEFYLIGVPPGNYNIEFSYIGYAPLTVRDLLVRVDLTSTLDVKIKVEAIEGDEIEVVADRLMVQKDITFTRRLATEEDFVNVPGMESSADVFRMQAGAITDIQPVRLNLDNGQQLQVRDESLKNIHVRGGRGGEILYMVDGMPVTHPLYGGRSVLDLNVSDVSQIEILSGAFSAEYGQAQSGVVNITTKTGGDILSGNLEFKTDNGLPGFDNSYNTDYLSFTLGGPVRLLGSKLNFFTSGNLNRTDTWLNNGRTRKELNWLGLDLNERQDNNVNLNAKLNYSLTDQINLILSYNDAYKQWSNYNWMWHLAPNNMAEFNRQTNRYNLRLNHFVSKKTFYNLNVGYMTVKYNASIDGRSEPDEWWVFRDGDCDEYPDSIDCNGPDGFFNNDTLGDTLYSNITNPVVDQVTGFYNNTGREDIWRDDFTKTLTIKADLTSQYNKYNMIKTGISIQTNDLHYVDIADGATNLSVYGQQYYTMPTDSIIYPEPPGPFPQYGRTRWVFDAKPITGALYLENKFEIESLILNAGARVDFLYLGKSVESDQFRSDWENATGLTADWKLTKAKFSPRFGISFPVTEYIVLFFSYGHFLQTPELQYYYRDPYTGGFTGNPHLDYEQTVLYEFGFTNQFADNLSLDIKAYNKDISDQTQTLQLYANLGLPVWLYDNRGFARARGLEFELNKKPAGRLRLLSGKMTYTVQWATGYSSSTFGEYVWEQYGFPNPIRERRLNWDVRHQVVSNITLSAPRGRDLSLFGIKLPTDWALTFLTRFSTGKAYTPGTMDIFEQRLLENTGSYPSTIVTDVKFNKFFSIPFINNSLTFYAEVYNLFDRNNPQGVNNWTGYPYAYGDLLGGSSRYYSHREITLYRQPMQFDQDRYLKVGINLNF